MAIITNNYRLSLSQNDRDMLRIRCSQNDSGVQINFTLYNNGEVFTIPSGISAVVNGVKSNGVIFSKDCTISSNKVILTLSSNVTDVAGVTVAEVVLVNSGGDRVGSSNFVILVEPNPLLRGKFSESTVSPTEYISDLISALESLNARVNNIITPSGDASLSEVVDARLSSLLSTTYSTLKERIDADISAISSDIANLHSLINSLEGNYINNCTKVEFLGGDISVGWESGSYNFANGTAGSTSTTTRIRTKGYIDSYIVDISIDTENAQFGLFAYNENDEYVGCWNGTSFGTVTAWIESVDFTNLPNNYKYKLSIKDANNASAIITTDYANYIKCHTDIGKTIKGIEGNIGDIEDDILASFQGEAMVTASSLPDLDGAKINRYYCVNSTTVENLPVQQKGHLLYFGLEGGETTIKSGREVQIYITGDNDFYYRANKFLSSAPFNEWDKLAKYSDISSTIQEVIETMQESKASLSLFESIGIIGDSFASGEIYNASEGTHADYYNLSWGQIMGRMIGASVVNYSKGGLTTKSWLTNETYGLAKLNSESANNLYIIALGINDANHSDTIPVGSISDIISDSTASFYSYYGRIIRAVQSHAPNAIIVLSTLARWNTTYNSYSDAVKAIANYYDLMVMDLSLDEYFTSDYFSVNQVSGHPTAVNYSGMAKAYKRMLENLLDENIGDLATYIGNL